jgi:hypothetical protein
MLADISDEDIYASTAHLLDEESKCPQESTFWEAI